VARIKKEASLGKDGNVMFAVMGIHSQGKKPNVVYSTLSKLHEKQKFFSYGVSDTTSGISLYKPHVNHGIVVTGKPTETQLPEPFDQVPGVAGHQIHHKFVVCGFNRADATLYCGSSNLAEGGETKNGDNLIEIQDKDIATVFAIEAVALVDHFNFLDNYQNEKKKATKEKSKSKEPITSKREAAKDAHWYLSTSDGWTAKYYDPEDLKCVDRELFA
jgi:hypothetical protein